MEEWRPYRDTNYLVSNLGRVRGPSGRILRPRPGAHGYLRVILCIGGVSRDAYISRMVAEAFIGVAPSPEHHADHKDRIVSNNTASNLRWLSPEENRALRVFPVGEQNHNAKLTAEQVRDMRSRPRGRGMTTILAAEYGISRRQVRDIINCKSWRHI
jgi:hypothetical protein